MPETKEMFDMALRLLDREDQLINSRMTWYLNIQGYIIASVALTFTGNANAKLQTPWILGVSILGFFISWIVLIAVFRARKAKRNVNKKWAAYESGDKDEFPDPRGEPGGRSSALTPSQTVPVIFMLFWIAAIFVASRI